MWFLGSIACVQLALLLGSLAGKARAELRILTVTEDYRPYCLLLRPFNIPEVTWTTTVYAGAEWPATKDIRLEEVIESAVHPIPLVYLVSPSSSPTVGRHSPGSVPIRCEQDDWFAIVSILVQGCQGVILVPGDGEGIFDELALLSELDSIKKTIVVIPPDSFNRREERWKALKHNLSQLGYQLPEYSRDGAIYSPDPKFGITRIVGLKSDEDLFRLTGRMRPQIQDFLKSLPKNERLADSYRKVEVVARRKRLK